MSILSIPTIAGFPTVLGSYSLIGQVGNFDAGTPQITVLTDGLYQISTYIVVTACPTDTYDDNGIVVIVSAGDGVTTPETSNLNPQQGVFSVPRKQVGANAGNIFSRYITANTPIEVNVSIQPPHASPGSTYNFYLSVIGLT